MGCRQILGDDTWRVERQKKPWSEETGRGGPACERGDKLKVKRKSINTQIKVKSSSPFLVHRLDNIFLNRSVLPPLLALLLSPRLFSWSCHSQRVFSLSKPSFIQTQTQPKCAGPTAGMARTCRIGGRRASVS